MLAVVIVVVFMVMVVVRGVSHNCSAARAIWNSKSVVTSCSEYNIYTVSLPLHEVSSNHEFALQRSNFSPHCSHTRTGWLCTHGSVFGTHSWLVPIGHSTTCPVLNRVVLWETTGSCWTGGSGGESHVGRGLCNG